MGMIVLDTLEQASQLRPLLTPCAGQRVPCRRCPMLRAPLASAYCASSVPMPRGDNWNCLQTLSGSPMGYNHPHLTTTALVG